MNVKDYYAALGISRDAGVDDVRRAFRLLAKRWHPDLNNAPGAEALFKEINEAYRVLSDPQRRERYDQALAAAEAAYQSARADDSGGDDDSSQGERGAWSRILTWVGAIVFIAWMGYSFFGPDLVSTPLLNPNRVVSVVVFEEGPSVEIEVDKQNNEDADIVAMSFVVRGSCRDVEGMSIISRDCDEAVSLLKPPPQGSSYTDLSENSVVARNWIDANGRLTVWSGAVRLPAGRYDVYVWEHPEGGGDTLSAFATSAFTIE